MRVRAALLITLCLGIVLMSGPVAAAVARPAVDAGSTPSSPPVTTAPAVICETSDLAMSTPSSAEVTTVYSTGTRAVDPVALRNTSSVDCPDSGFIVLLMSPAKEPEPTLEWRVDGGAWHDTYLSWDDGVVNGNASCASPCWKAGIVKLDVRPHTTDTIDLAVIFHSGLNNGFFSGAVYYTGQAVIPDGVSGAVVAWSYINRARGAGAGGGSGGGSGAPNRGPSPVSSRTTGPPQSSAASPEASPSPSASAAIAPAAGSSSSPAAPMATPSLARVADAHPDGFGISTVITVIAVAILALAAGAGWVLTRRRRGSPPQSRV